MSLGISRPLLGGAALALSLAVVGCVGSPEPADDRDAGAPTSSGPSPTQTQTEEPAVAVWPADGPYDGYVETRLGAAPSLDELALSPEGLTGLPLGTVLPTARGDADPVVYDPAACEPEVAEGSATEPGLWVANYREWFADPSFPYWGAPFSVMVDDSGRLTVVQVGYRSDALATDRGIRMGSTEAEVRAAYPDAESVGFFGDALVFVVRGAAGSLHIGIADEDGGGRHVVSILAFDDPGREAALLWATDGTYALACAYA